MFKHRPFLWSLLLLALALILSVSIGTVSIRPGELWQIVLLRLTSGIPADSALRTLNVIVFDLRLPHTALILLTGAALSGSGAAYQGLFRNPLADPFLIGVASGAGLGAVLAISRHGAERSLWGVPLAAFVGALLTVLLVYFLARVGHALPVTTLILAGVAVNAFASSLTSFLILRSQGELRRAISWLLGGGSLGGWPPVWAALPYVALGLGVLLVSGHALNVLQFGDEQALTLGLSVRQVKWLLIGAASLATAAAVAFSGIIGFIGLVVPHAVRLLWGEDYRRLIPLAVLNGGAVLLLADLLARVVMAPQVLPVGIVTALVGAPFFLFLLRRAKEKVYW